MSDTIKNYEDKKEAENVFSEIAKFQATQINQGTELESKSNLCKTCGIDHQKESLAWVEQGTKFDEGKNKLDLVPPEFIEATGWILTMGANKYGDQNWRAGLKYSRVLSALLRHLFAWARGERIDSESGKSHLWHAACNLSFLITFESHPEVYEKFDDLWKYNDHTRTI